MIAFEQQEMDIQKFERFHFSWLKDPEHATSNVSALQN
jgi:hypothetical protein